MIKKNSLFVFLLLCLPLPFSIANASGEIAQTLSISTNFRTIVGNPTWMIELRDIESGLVLPYIFDIHENKNYWLAFSKQHTYRVVASILKFGPYVTVNNFCGLQSGILTGKSMYIRVSGNITPDLRFTKCQVIKFKQEQFTVAEPE